MSPEFAEFFAEAPTYLLNVGAVVLVLMLVGAILALKHWRTWATNPPLWKRKSAIAVAILWLAMIYPLSVGPAVYVVGRKWVPVSIFVIVYRPLEALVSVMPDNITEGFTRYTSWFRDRAQYHDLDL